jgi:hypothetical protein
MGDPRYLCPFMLLTPGTVLALQNVYSPGIHKGARALGWAIGPNRQWEPRSTRTETRYSQEIRELDRSAIAARLWNAASETLASPEERTSKDGRVVPHALAAWASIRSTLEDRREARASVRLLKSVLAAL